MAEVVGYSEPSLTSASHEFPSFLKCAWSRPAWELGEATAKPTEGLGGSQPCGTALGSYFSAGDLRERSGDPTGEEPLVFPETRD